MRISLRTVTMDIPAQDVIHAEGEYQAAEKLAQAADVISAQPAAVHLRFLQTMNEVATEKNSTIIFPIPIDLLRQFFQKK